MSGFDDLQRAVAAMAQSRVCDLVPGDLVAIPTGDSAVYVAQTPHPLWPGLHLVIWRMPDGTWSHDALDARQVVGQVQESTLVERIGRLRWALLQERS